MVEVHPNPREALCDGPQSLDLPGLRSLVAELKPLAAAIGKTIG
jgi:3-deoxy-7-phosphoheptulonate synthase